METKIKDNYFEHSQHSEYDVNCSSCFSVRKESLRARRQHFQRIRENLGYTTGRALRSGEDNFTRETNPFND